MDRDQIWNRAARHGGGPAPRQGDTALASLLQVHRMVTEGGIEHALETLSPQQYKAGVAGYRYFGLTGAAIVLEQARIARLSTDADLQQLTANYESNVPDDNRIFQAFQLKLLVSPEDFCPLEG